MMRFLSLLMLGLCASVVSCGSPWYVCEVVVVPYVVGAVVAVTDACTVVCVYDARMLRCEGDGNAGVGSGGCVVALSAYMGGARGSGGLSSACDVLEMSVVRGVCGACDMCKCLAGGELGGVVGEWLTGLGLDVYQFWRNMGKI